VEVLPEVDVDQDRRVDAPEELGLEVVITAEVGQRVVVVDRTVVVVVVAVEEGLNTGQIMCNHFNCSLFRYFYDLFIASCSVYHPTFSRNQH
jgi:hypothetical protein